MINERFFFHRFAPKKEQHRMHEDGELVPISTLALDLPALSIGGWPAYLKSRGIPIRTDDIGRECITRHAAKQLFDEKREAEIRAREIAERRERQALEAEKVRVAGLQRGVPWHELPPGVLPVMAMTQAVRDSRPKRRTLLEDALDGDVGTAFYPLPPASDEES